LAPLDFPEFAGPPPVVAPPAGEGVLLAAAAPRRRVVRTPTTAPGTAERLAWDEAWTDSGRVFTRENGTSLDPSFVTARFQRLAFAAGLPPIRLHDLRHGAASLAKRAGADIKAIREMLRHSSHAITADTYTSTFEDDDRAVAEAIAAVGAAEVRRGEASETDVPCPSSVPGRKPKGFRPAT
jgi:integrase